MRRNPYLAKLQAGYLFPEINRRKNEFLKEEPEAKLISLGIGNTTEPLTSHIAGELQSACTSMTTRAGYSGYGAEQGFDSLREKISEVMYKGIVQPDEIFISDGAKCDAGRLQMLFGSNIKVAVQDPAYPVYVDSAVMMGQTGDYNPEKGLFDGIHYLACSPENNYFPKASELPDEVDLIFICSPNNPTGAVATREQLQELVDAAKERTAIIVFDAAYSMFIQDPELPRSIFEIPGAREVAVEINSFSKSAGFTGVRLGWSVVPNELCFDDGTPVRNDWNRVMTTVFNGASNIIQQGGLAALDSEGFQELEGLVSFYMENGKILAELLDQLELDYIGGKNSPYLWLRTPGKSSWEVFDKMLRQAQVICTPGSGFGPAGEGFVRLSAFGRREDIHEAASRLKSFLTEL